MYGKKSNDREVKKKHGTLSYEKMRMGRSRGGWMDQVTYGEGGKGYEKS